MNENLNFEQIIKETIEIRRKLHQKPELGMKEYETSALIALELEKMGLKPDRICHTGVTAVVQGKYPGKTILYRADMDALPVKEETGLSFQSLNNGIMHACGHDIHMACALGTAKVINQMRDQMHGNLKLMFQPCEENFPGGAGRMIEAGILQNPTVDAAVALHVTPDFDAGKYFLASGAVTSSPSWFDIEVKGRGGHASEPEKCINPIKAASHIYLKMENLALKYKKENAKTVISTTMFHGGDAQNIIPETCNLSGTVRTFSSEDTRIIEEDIVKICKSIEEQTRVRIKVKYRTSMNSVYNNPQITKIMRQTICDVIGSKALTKKEWTFMGGEDYAEISDRIPSVFLFAGVRDCDKKYSYPLHNAKFYADERMLGPAIKVMTKFIIRCLKSVEKSDIFI